MFIRSPILNKTNTMKKLITLALIISLTAPIFAQKNESSRDWTSLTFSMIGKKCSKKENKIHNQKGLPKWGEYSLKDESASKLNTIEQRLLTQYSDVIITKYHHGYFLIKNDAIGLATPKGNVLINPVNGKVRVTVGSGYASNLYLFGDQTSDFDIWNEIINNTSNNASYDIAIPLGLFQGVAKFTPSGFQEIIPDGKYDYISLVLRSKTLLTNSKTGFYVYKQQENGEYLCGYCDAEGNEIIPCNYRSIYFDGKGFKGDNSKSILEWNDEYINQMNLKKELAEQRRAQWASALNTFGNAISGIASNIGSKATNITPATSSNHNSSSSKNSDKKSSADLNNRNTAYSAYEGYANELMKMANGQISYNDNLRKKYQAEMKNIREKWTKKGYQFTKLSWEDWGGK